jgi:adenylate cyclase
VAPVNAQETIPSIAVLPLKNLSGDPADDYFADGIVEDIIMSLAGLRELLVISRGSTLAYRAHQVDLKEVGRCLGARYVLRGSVKRSKRAMFVSTELYDTSTGARMWGEDAEAPLGDLFEVQDHVVGRIAPRVAPNVRAAELRGALRKRPESFTAYDWTLRALHILHSLEARSFLRARDFLSKAMREDPGFAMPTAWAARWHSLHIGQGWSSAPERDAEKGLQLAERAIKLDGQNALALATLGHLKSYLRHDYESALVYFDRALTACPNHSIAWLLSSRTLSYVGRCEQAIRHAEQALRLSPLDRSAYSYYEALNAAHYANGNYQEAVKWGHMCAAANSMYSSNLRYLAAGLAALGREHEARHTAMWLMQLEPEFRLGRYERTLQPFRVPAIRARYMEHLSKAGLPE